MPTIRRMLRRVPGADRGQLRADLSPGAGVIPADLGRGQPTGEEFGEFGLLSAIEGPFRDEADRPADLPQVPESRALPCLAVGIPADIGLAPCGPQGERLI